MIFSNFLMVENEMVGRRIRLEPRCVKSDKMGLYYVHFLKVMRVILSVYLSVFFPYFDRSYSLSVLMT